MRRRLRAAALGALAALAVALSACGAGDSAGDEAATTAYGQALESVGDGVSPIGTGFGWIDLAATPSPGAVALALGPGPSSFIAHPGLLRQFGIDLRDADSATSVAASYGYGVRLDGVDPQALRKRFLAAGAEASRSGRWTDLDLGSEWEAPLSGGLVPLRDYAAQGAIGPGSVILSRTAGAREALEDASGSALEAPANRFAATCLGEVDSARTLPGTFTHNSFSSPELIAIGVVEGSPVREVLCAIGDDAVTADGWAKALERSFAPGAREPQLGTPIGRSVDAAVIERIDDEDAGLHAARAELTVARAEQPGFLFGALVRGSVLPYVGAPAPLSSSSQTAFVQREP